MSELTELTLTAEDYDKAFSEVSFLLDVLSRTIGQVVGHATTSMSVSSGRHMAKKLPVHLSYPPAIDEVMEVFRERLEAGFDIDFTCDGNAVNMKIGRCAIREACKDRDLPVGGELCTMLHDFWAGMIAELRGLPMRTKDVTAGDSCSLSLG